MVREQKRTGILQKNPDGISDAGFEHNGVSSPEERRHFPSLEMVKPMENPLERIANLVRGKDRAGAFLWKLFSAMLCLCRQPDSGNQR